MRISEILNKQKLELIKNACIFIRGYGVNIQRVEIGDKVVRPMQFFKNGKEVIENIVYLNPPKERENHEQ